MLPEIFVICFIMLHQIKLHLLGLYYTTEEDIETIKDGQERLLAEGDLDEVKRKKVFNTNMAMQIYFNPRSLQHEENQANLLKELRERDEEPEEENNS